MHSVYNVIQYLDVCMKSILNQTYQRIEVILVDDGSTDGSEQKCDYYARIDDRVVSTIKMVDSLTREIRELH